MPETAMPIATRERLWRLALAAVPAFTLAWLRGADSNWDLRNYHLYNPHAWLTGRLATDVAPAQLQSWHNPLLDVPLYLIVQSGAGLHWASAWLALPWAIAIYLLLGLHARLAGGPPSRTEQVVLALLALGGASTWATLANSMNDGFVAAAMLGALALVVRERDAAPRWLVAGLLAGAMTGLKLTAGVYCIGLAAMALVPGARPGWRATLARVACLGAGGLAGFALTYGAWGWMLMADFGNPFFPYFNQVFGSPWAPARDFVDARFRAQGLWDAVTIPLQLLADGTARSELRLRDPRLLVGAVGLPLLAWARARRHRGSDVARLAVFFWVALLAWALEYGIYRYAATLELLGALTMALWLARLPRWRMAACLLVLVLASAATRRPDWGHVHDAPPRYGLAPPALPARALVLVGSGEPLAYLALALPADTTMVGLENNMMRADGCSQLEVRARLTIRAHGGQAWLLSPGVDAAREDLRRLAIRIRIQSRPAPPIHYSSALGDVVFTPVAVGPPRQPCP